MTQTGFYFDTIDFALASAVADAGTVTVSYPTGRSKGNYEFANSKHVLILDGNVYNSPADFTLTFNANASNITLTNATGASWPQGAIGKLQLNLNGRSRGGSVAVENPGRVHSYREVLLDLGSPNAADPDGIFESYTGSTPALDGALVSGGVATFDVPRNIVIDSGGVDTAVLTFTGTDEYGNVIVESMTLNGTTAVQGKKAFKTVTAVSSSAAIANGAFAGTGNILGLPIAITNTGQVLKELEDGAAATAGTLVTALENTESAATTADVRGTYTPNTTPDGDAGFALLVSVPDPSDIGVAQYAG